MRKRFGQLLLGGALLFAIVGLIWQWQLMSMPPPPASPRIDVPQEPAAPAPAPAPAAHYPLPQIEPERAGNGDSRALPSLQDSDAPMWTALGELWDRTTVATLFYPAGIVRHLVATIDNLPRRRVSPQILPVKPVGGAFLTKGDGPNLVIAPENAARYQAYVRLAESVDPKRLVAFYVRHYPWFQQAYADLGYPGSDFNDRLIAVIDHLLEAPEDQEPYRLVQPHVAYRFVDPGLEASSAGHKALIRMGSENAARIKAVLRKIRDELTRPRPK